MKLKTWYLLFMIFLLTFSLKVEKVRATVSLDIVEVSPSIVWLHEENPIVTVKVDCEINGSSADLDDVSGIIYSLNHTGVYAEINFNKKENELLIGTCDILQSMPTGVYTANVSCGNETESANFEVHRLELEVVFPTYENPLEVPMGSKIGVSTPAISVIFKYDGQDPQSSPDFKVYLDDTLLNETTPTHVSDYTFNLTARIPLEGLTQGFYDLRVVADFMQGKIEKVERESVKVMQPLFIQDAYFDDDNTCNSNEICSKTIILDLLYSGKKEFDSEDFDFSVYVNELEKKVGVDQVICTQVSKASASVSCVLSVNFPALDPGSYTIDVSLTSKLEPYLKDERVLYLDVVISLSGTLMDATGGIIHGAKLTFENLETGEIYSRTTDALGKYSVDLLPGRYNVLLEFSNLRADLKDVKINKDTLGDIGGELIKYDSFGASGVIEGFKVTKVVVLEFGLPFKKAYLVIPYDDRYVYDENQLQVFKCKNWNFGARRCVGNWSEVDSKVYPTRNRVEFNVSSLSAFVLGERKQLSFYTLSLNKEEVNMGDTIVITGKVVDSEGKGVEGVNLEFSFPDFGINTSTITTTGGVFSGTITAPYKDGVFKLVVRANKGPYSPAVEEKPIKVTKKGDFSIILPDVVNVILDQPQEINLTLVNSGQLDLEKIKIRVSGISTDFFNLIPPEINLLKPNEQKKITMRFMFTSENCGEKCSQYYLVSLGVEATTSLGEKISKGGSFTVKLLPPQKPEEKEEGQLNLKLPSLTGLFVLPKSLNNQTNLMIVVAVILLVVAIISKMKIPRRRGGKSLSYRSFNRSLIGRIKKEVKGK